MVGLILFVFVWVVARGYLWFVLMVGLVLFIVG